jgi:hypothetical protein
MPEESSASESSAEPEMVGVSEQRTKQDVFEKSGEQDVSAYGWRAPFLPNPCRTLPALRIVRNLEREAKGQGDD